MTAPLPSPHCEDADEPGDDPVPVVLFLPEILRQTAGDHRSDPVNGAYLFFTGPADLIQIVAEMPADHLCVARPILAIPRL